MNMTKIAHDVLDMNVTDHGTLQLSKRVVELAPVVESAIDAVDAATADQPRTLEVTKPAEPVFVFADRARLQHVFAKLLLNASNFTDAFGRITIDMQLDSDDVVITVADNGIGLVDADVDQLGLPLVTALVVMHGGTISARSDGPGKGSAFEVRLPVITPERLRALRSVH